MSDNRPEDEIAALFEQVLNSAQAADAEMMDEFMAEAETRMTELLEAGLIPVNVTDIDGVTHVQVPADIMYSLITALSEYMSADQEIAHWSEAGFAAVATGPINDTFSLRALATKVAFITLAMVRHNEQKMERG